MPPPPPPRPARTARDGAAIGLLTGGGVAMGLGLTSIVLIAGPAALAKRVAKGRADDDNSIGSSVRAARYRRARNADDTMEGAFWTGVGLLGAGVLMLAVGAGLKASGRSRAAARLSPSAGGMAVRF
ncbi:MAG: hypothetical protein U0168_05020 [Nannocystaceae bacterium]